MTPEELDQAKQADMQNESSPTKIVMAAMAENRGRILRSLGDRHDGEKFLAGIQTAFSMNPKLYQCTPASVIRSIIRCAEVALIPSGSFGYCWLVPYYNKTLKTLECSFQIGYQGLLQLIYETGLISHVVARTHYESDTFTIEYGTSERIHHIPSYGASASKSILGVYVVITLLNSNRVIMYSTFEEIEEARVKSMSDTFWKAGWDTMAYRIPLKKVMKFLPKTLATEKIYAAFEDENNNNNNNNNMETTDDNNR